MFQVDFRIGSLNLRTSNNKFTLDWPGPGRIIESDFSREMLLMPKHAFCSEYRLNFSVL